MGAGPCGTGPSRSANPSGRTPTSSRSIQRRSSISSCGRGTGTAAMPCCTSFSRVRGRPCSFAVWGHRRARRSSAARCSWAAGPCSRSSRPGTSWPAPHGCRGRPPARSRPCAVRRRAAPSPGRSPSPRPCWRDLRKACSWASPSRRPASARAWTCPSRGPPGEQPGPRPWRWSWPARSPRANGCPASRPRDGRHAPRSAPRRAATGRSSRPVSCKRCFPCLSPSCP